MRPIEIAEFISLSAEAYVVVDTRKSEMLSEGFFKDSISIPLDESFINTFQELVGSMQNVILVADENEIPAIMKRIKDTGITNIHGYLSKGRNATEIPAKFIDVLITIDSEELLIDYRFDEFYLIDVRTLEEFEKEHLEHAENISLNDLEQLLIALDASKSYYVYADTAVNAVTAGSIFKRSGFDLVKVIAGNFENIKASGIPLIGKNKNEKSSAKSSNN